MTSMVNDEDSCVFSLDYFIVYKKQDDTPQIVHSKVLGPTFGVNSLTSNGNLMQGQCCVNKKREQFGVQTDSFGNNALTGYGSG